MLKQVIQLERAIIEDIKMCNQDLASLEERRKNGEIGDKVYMYERHYLKGKISAEEEILNRLKKIEAVGFMEYDR